MALLDICQLARQSQPSRSDQGALDFIRSPADHFVDGIAQGIPTDCPTK